MTTSSRAIAIVGMGAVSPIGIGTRAFISALRAGRSGVQLLPDDLPGRKRIESSVAATCDEFDPRSAMTGADLARLPRLIPMALACAREAMEESCLTSWLCERDTPDRSQGVGLILGTGAGGIDFTLDQAQRAYAADHESDSRRGISLWTITNATHGNLAGELSIRLGLRGASLCVSTGCASSSDAIGHALEVLRGDRPGSPRAVVVVGADAHVRWETLAGMELLKVISRIDFRRDGRMPESASRPFDRGRDGFILGEGAWAIILERMDHAHERGAPILGELLGYGATCDAYHRVRPDPDMRESARAMKLAMEDARAAPEDIRVMHYHGTSTQLNDSSETDAVKLAFGAAPARRLIGHSIKSMIGHPQGACGAAALVGTLGALSNLDGDPRGPFSPPTINLDDPDVEGGCDLDYTPHEARSMNGEKPIAFMVNCLAFGAKNSALVVRTYPPGA